MKISVIGAGAMGGAIVRGLLKSGAAESSDITVADASDAARARFEGTGVHLTADNAAAAAVADLVCVVVKPWIVESVISELRPVLDASRQMVAVVAAGVASADICQWLSGDGGGKVPPLFLVIPNTAIAELSSMTFIVPVGATAGQTATLCDLFGRMGSTLVIEERLLPAGTTLASCGIAYAMRYVRAATEGGVELGFRADDALRIVLQTVRGAADLLLASGNHPEAEIDKVTTPGGLTIRGINEMEHAGFTSAVIRGLKAGMS